MVNSVAAEIAAREIFAFIEKQKIVFQGKPDAMDAIRAIEAKVEAIRKQAKDGFY